MGNTLNNFNCQQCVKSYLDCGGKSEISVESIKKDTFDGAV